VNDNFTELYTDKAPLASPTFTGAPAAPTAAGGTNTTQIATTAFVTSAVSTAVTGLLDFKGNTDCSANPNYPAASKGDAYYVSVAGKIGGASGKSVDVGDVYIASADNAGGTEASVGTSWFVLEHNLTSVLSGSTASTTEQLTGTDTSKVSTPDSVAALWEQGADVASSGTVSLGEGGYFFITGTTTITDIDFATDKAGRKAWVKFAGALTLTHNSSTLILPSGANITTAAGDTACFLSEGSDVVRCVAYQKANGQPVVSGSGSTPNALTITSSGGASPGATFDGSSAKTIDYSTVGAAKTGAATGSGLTMATARLLGRTTASTGAVEEITVGSGLSLSSGTLTATGVGGGATGSSYAQYLAALLEPDAIEAFQTGSFSYAVNSSTTKLLLSSWSTKIGTGRMEQRNPQRPFALRNVTLSGQETSSYAVVLNPTAATYADAWATYYTRLQAIWELGVKNIPITTVSQKKPLLPGAYGAIITQVTCFDLCWITLLVQNLSGINLWDEISDTASQRIGDSLMFPVSKNLAGEIQSSANGSTPDVGHSEMGSVSYVLLPSTWSAIADPVSASYGFRDDFMGSSLDVASTWTRTQSTAGNIEINTDYQWCKVTGNGSWGANSLRKTASMARVNGRTLVVDVYMPTTATSSPGFAVEWNDGSGIAPSNGVHRVELGNPSTIYIKESGTLRASLTSPTYGWTAGCCYRIKIALGTSGATYSIQGGREYPAIGSASWTNLPPGTTAGTTTPLYPCIGAFGSHDYYASDVRVFG
jgi:hypothetical protein